jgi:hypothetical protein
VVVEGDLVYAEGRPGVVYKVARLCEDQRFGDLVVEQTDEPEHPLGQELEAQDLRSLLFIGEFADLE